MHADCVDMAPPKQRRAHARKRIKQRVMQHFLVDNLYEVQDRLQQEARQAGWPKGNMRIFVTQGLELENQMEKETFNSHSC